jgi:hypothetical protein
MFFTNVHHGYSYNTLHIKSPKLHAKNVTFWKLALLPFSSKRAYPTDQVPVFPDEGKRTSF